MASLRPLLLAGVAALAVAGDRPLDRVPLTWKPTSRLSDAVGVLNLTPFAQVRLAVLPFSDPRADRQVVGENVEGESPKLVTTKDEPAAFLAARTRDLLRSAGLPLTDRPEEATVTLSAEVLRFRVSEHQTYVGETSLLVTVKAGSQELWRGTLLGRATRFGRSYKLENYHEALCDSLVNALTRGLQSPDFLGALAGQAAAR